MISIIVPIYNAEKYLIRCLNSIDNQTIKNLEVILIDDGSNDSSEHLIDSYIFRHAKKIVVHKGNEGLVPTWKLGVSLANGDYIGFVDSDDYIEPNMYETMYNAALKDGSDMVICNKYDEWPNGNKIIPNALLDAKHYEGEDYKKLISLITPHLNADYLSPSRCYKIVKKNIIMKSLDTIDNLLTSGEDNAATIRWFIDSSSLDVVNEPLYHYCHNKESMSFTYNPSILDQYLSLINGIIGFNETRGNIIPINELFNLYNFYGFVWCKYVCSSNLSKKEKKNEIKRLCHQKEFRQALKYSEKGHIARTLLYKMTMIFKNPFFIMAGLKGDNK